MKDEHFSIADENLGVQRVQEGRVEEEEQFVNVQLSPVNRAVGSMSNLSAPGPGTPSTSVKDREAVSLGYIGTMIKWILDKLVRWGLVSEWLSQNLLACFLIVNKDEPVKLAGEFVPQPPAATEVVTEVRPAQETQEVEVVLSPGGVAKLLPGPASVCKRALRYYQKTLPAYEDIVVVHQGKRKK
ncbi:MAG: hypothetical protein LBB16_02350 [Puniceicoccales bacterium]|jgi:hypothetical protein|nr:hypothetical protein [Puniceicoccales bacterium]